MIQGIQGGTLTARESIIHAVFHWKPWYRQPHTLKSPVKLGSMILPTQPRLVICLAKFHAVKFVSMFANTTRSNLTQQCWLEELCIRHKKLMFTQRSWLESEALLETFERVAYPRILKPAVQCRANQCDQQLSASAGATWKQEDF